MAKSVPSFWDRIKQSIDWQSRLRRCLSLAALACILRPTNVLIWMSFACFAVLRIVTLGKMLSLPFEGMQIWLHISSLSLLPATKKERLTLLREVALCGYVPILLQKSSKADNNVQISRLTTLDLYRSPLLPAMDVSTISFPLFQYSSVARSLLRQKRLALLHIPRIPTTPNDSSTIWRNRHIPVTLPS